MSGTTKLDDLEKFDLESVDLSKIVALAESLPEFVELIDPALLEELCATYRETSFATLPDGRKPELNHEQNFEEIFGGRTLVLYRWILAATLYNFADFSVGRSSRGTL